jgi:aspartate oxidase
MIPRNLLRLALGISLSVAISTSAFAQYGGGGTSSGGTTSSSGNYSSSTGIAIGVAVAAGAGILIYALHHRGTSPTQATLVGCTKAVARGEGAILVNEKDKEAYTLVAGSTDLKPGERVELTGKKTQDGSGKRTFQVQKLARDYGPCNTETAINAPSN